MTDSKPNQLRNQRFKFMIGCSGTIKTSELDGYSFYCIFQSLIEQAVKVMAIRASNRFKVDLYAEGSKIE